MTGKGGDLPLLGSSDSAAIDALSDRFRAAWQAGTPPAFDEMLARWPGPDPRDLLCKLIGIDLDFRWRRAGNTSAWAVDSALLVAGSNGAAQTSKDLPERPVLEDYIRRFPQLGPLEQLPDELIAQGYRVRRRCGDRVDPADYRRRFGGQRTTLIQLLAEIDPEAGSRQHAATHGTVAWHQSCNETPDAQANEEPFPSHVSRYKVLARLGKGGFGVVYHAFDPEIKREVAIKLPRAEVAQAEVVFEACRAEAQSLGHVPQSARIVTVYDFGRTDDGQPFIVMEYVPGGSLADRLGQEPLSRLEAVRLAAEIAEGLHQLHQAVHVHRDVKPGNILLDPQRGPLLADLGMALPDGAFGSGPNQCGTYSYMSPEQADDRAHLAYRQTSIGL